ncbi:MAG: TadE family protein [Candidatus Dormibacteria bacterium]
MLLPRAHSRGQAMVEFSMVVVILFLGIFAVIDAALWGVEMSAAVSAGASGVLDASSALGTGTKSNTPALNSAQQVIPQLQLSMFGTPICFVNTAGPTLKTVGSVSLCPGEVANCNISSTGGSSALDAINGGKPKLIVCVGEAAPLVTVKILGFANGFVPFGLFGGGGIPIYTYAESHLLTFQT